MPDLQSSQAKAYLKAMGIEVWHERQPQAVDVVHVDENTTPVKQVIAEPCKSEAAEKAPAQETPVTATIPVPQVSTFSWQELHNTVSVCQQCELSGERTKTVFGAGNQQASLMIISGSPDDTEDKAGEPFQDESGQLLNAMLKAIGFNRNQVYITNITKCKTPGNREPSDTETEQCLDYLKRQVELVEPDLILALGLTAAQGLLKTPSTLNRLRGQLHYVDNVKCPVAVSYHPAYLLCAPSEKRKAWEDLKMVMQYPGLNKG